MQIRLQILIIVASLTVFFAILELIRRGRLREEYSLFWLFSAAMVFILALFKGSLRFIAGLVEIEYAPSFIFMVGIGLVIVIQLLQTVSISKLTSQNRDLAQWLAILQLQLKDHSGPITDQGELGPGRISLDQLRTISQQLQGHADRQGFISRSLELALSSIGATSGSLLLLDEAGHLSEAALKHADQTLSVAESDLDETVENGLAGWVVRHRQPALVESTREDQRWLKRPWDDQEGGSRSAVSVPLLLEDQVVGVLTLAHPQARKFTQEDLVLLTAFAAVVSASGQKVLELEAKPSRHPAVVEEV